MFFKKSKQKNSRSVLNERLSVKTRINGGSNPILFALEEKISILLNEKYMEEFQLNSLNSKNKDPDYEVDAEVDYNVGCKKEKGFWSKLFGSKKKSGEVIKNRLDILIQGKKDDSMLEKIRQDIYQMAKNMMDIEPHQINVERCYTGDSIEVIRMVVSLNK